MVEDYRTTLKNAALEEESFVRLTFKGNTSGEGNPWRRVVVRPVLIKGARHLQFSYFDTTKDITKNYRGDEVQEKLDEVLAMPFGSIFLEGTGENWRVQIGKGGKALLHREKVEGSNPKPDLSHDKQKVLALPEGKPDKFLQELGVMSKDGRVIASMQGKFSQINEFLKLLEHTGELGSFDRTPVNILDCGSGSSYLSFAVYHYLNDVRGVPTRLVGIDVKGELVEKSNAHGEQLGFEYICFEKSAIITYKPKTPPDIVLALHACDTATDEAIAQGILNGSRLVLCVPCCHHDLNEQITLQHSNVLTFQPVLQHGILKQRMSDILTDAFRAHILRIMGYKADVIEFVSSEHTDRNLLIRAVKRTKPGDKKAMREYEDLKSFWGVTPYLEKLLRDRDCWPEQRQANE